MPYDANSRRERRKEEAKEARKYCKLANSDRLSLTKKKKEGLTEEFKNSTYLLPAVVDYVLSLLNDIEDKLDKENIYDTDFTARVAGLLESRKSLKNLLTILTEGK
jgi:hypothetical protein